MVLDDKRNDAEKPENKQEPSVLVEPDKPYFFSHHRKRILDDILEKDEKETSTNEEYKCVPDDAEEPVCARKRTKRIIDDTLTDDDENSYETILAEYYIMPLRKWIRKCLKFIEMQYDDEEPDEKAVYNYLQISVERLKSKNIVALAMGLSDIYCSEAIDILAELTKGMSPPTNLSFSTDYAVFTEMQLYQNL